MIAQSLISKLSNRLLSENGGRRIPEAVLERDYCMAWFLVGLSQTSLKNKLTFKGGTALRRCYFSDYRFSEDLDFTILQSLTLEELKTDLEEVYKATKAASNMVFRFSRPDSESHQNSYTFYLSYEGPLPNLSSPKEIKVDVTIKEKVVFKPEELPVLKSCKEFSDLPTDAKIKVYSLLEIASEKTVALLDKARSEPRDLYDLWYLTVKAKRVNLSDCLQAIHEKLAHRKKELTTVKEEFDRKEARLQKTWLSRLGAQMSAVPEFDGVFRAVKRNLRCLR